MGTLIYPYELFSSTAEPSFSREMLPWRRGFWVWGVLVIKFLEALIGHCRSFVSLPVVQDQDKQA